MVVIQSMNRLHEFYYTSKHLIIRLESQREGSNM